MSEKLRAHESQRFAGVVDPDDGDVGGNLKIKLVADNKSLRSLFNGGLGKAVAVGGISLETDESGAGSSLARVVDEVADIGISAAYEPVICIC